MSVTSFHLFSGARKSTLTMLRHFGMMRARLHREAGVLFSRAMGCGQGAAFSVWPDWQRYAVLMECASPDDEARVLQLPLFQNLIAAAKEYRTWSLCPIRKHGAWDGLNPFALEMDNDAVGHLAVLTRAAISVTHIPAFIRHSYKTTEALKVASGLQFSIGMGEYPLVRQATFSIWHSDAAMAAYAYADGRHIAAMKAKAVGGMFKEEQFVRFRVRERPHPGSAPNAG